MIDSPHKDIKLIILNRFKGLKTVFFKKEKHENNVSANTEYQ